MFICTACERTITKADNYGKNQHTTDKGKSICNDCEYELLAEFDSYIDMQTRY